MRLHGRHFACCCLSLLMGCGAADDAPSAGESDAATAAANTGSGKIEVAGDISATLDGEERTWNVLLVPADGEIKSTSVHRSRWVGSSRMRTLTLGGHVGEYLATNGMISLTVNTTEPLEECPCTLQNQSIEYWISASDVYRTSDASINLERFTSTADGWYQAAGSFSGTLLPAEEGATREGSEPMRIEGTFDIDRIRAVEF